MFPKYLLSIGDLTQDQATAVLNLALDIKSHPERYRTVLAHRNMAMLFEKPSLRTRVTFDVGFVELGGHALYLAPETVQMGKRESVGDVARGLERWVDLVVARVYAHNSLMEMVKHSQVPVINALSDFEHPCQALADLLTLLERDRDWSHWKIAFIGDGFNVSRSLLYLAGLLGVDVTVATPPGYELTESDYVFARGLSADPPRLLISHNPCEAIKGANVIYTDVWTSMGQEDQNEQRAKDFAGFQINAEMMKLAAPDAVVLHCLPAHRGVEITDEVLDGPQSVVFDQAENRLHAQKAVMALMLDKQLYRQHCSADF